MLENLKSDLIAQFALCLVLWLDDMIQMNRTDDHIYSYDFSEAFNVVDLKTILRMNDDAAVDWMRPQFWQFKRFTETEDFDVPGLVKEFHLEPGLLKDGMISSIKRAAETALKASGKFIPWQVVTISRDGRILE